MAQYFSYVSTHCMAYPMSVHYILILWGMVSAAVCPELIWDTLVETVDVFNTLNPIAVYWRNSSWFFRSNAIVLSMLLEPLQRGCDCLEKMNFGVEESVHVPFVMEHPHCLKGKSLLWLEEVIQLQRKLCTWLNMLVMFTYLFAGTTWGHQKQCKIGNLSLCDLSSIDVLLKIIG